MAGNKKKTRPRHRPASKRDLAISHPVWMANKMGPTSEAMIAELVVDARMALHRSASGEATDDDIESLASAANLALVLTERGHGAEYQSGVIAAQAALMQAIRRVVSGASFGFAGPELEQMRWLMELYEQLLQTVSHKEVMTALLVAIERAKRGHVMEIPNKPA